MPKTGENISKRSDGRWEARYICGKDVNGKLIYKSFYGKNRQEARQKRIQYIYECKLGMNEESNSSKIFFKDLVQDWLDSTKIRVKQSTFARYDNQVKKHILPYFEECQVSKINTKMIEQLVSDLLNGKDGKSGLSPKTVEDILILIKSIFKFGNVPNAPELNRIKIKKDKKPPCILPKQAWEKLVAFLHGNVNYVHNAIFLAMCTGIRIGELCALTWDDIDLESGMIRINKTMQRIQNVAAGSAKSEKKTKIVITLPKSSKSIREIPIPEFLTMILRKIKENPKDYLLTGSEKYMEPRTLQNHFKKILRQCEIGDYNFHAMRHTFATRYIEEGLDAKTLSEILGHSGVKVTLELYVHSSMDLKRANVEKIILLFTPSNKPSEQCGNMSIKGA